MQTTLPGMTFGAPGKRLNPSDGSDLAAGNSAHDAIHHVDESRGREQRVVPLVHRGRAGVILESGDRDLPLLDPDDSLDDADVDLRRVERAALLDVQLEVAGDRALRRA